MKLSNIRLQNFRSYKDQSFEFERGVNIVVGPNTSGKTNLLEAILLVYRGDSYKTANIDDLVKHNRPWGRIDAMMDDGEKRSLKLQTQTAPTRQYIINDKQYSRLTNEHARAVVLFEPAQLYLLTASPEARRNFVDDVLIQTSQEFRRVKSSFNRTLKQRNALLKHHNKQHIKQQIFAWNIRFSETASDYIDFRQELIEQLNKKLSKRYNHIADSKHNIKLIYKSTVITTNYANVLLQTLGQTLEHDIARGFTTVGPQRDDVAIQIDKYELKESASRGEIRTTLLALKLSEADLVEQKTNTPPLFLLDDVFGELDGKRRHALTDYLHDQQVLITTTDADVVQKNFAQKAHIISLTK